MSKRSRRSFTTEQKVVGQNDAGARVVRHEATALCEARGGSKEATRENEVTGDGVRAVAAPDLAAVKVVRLAVWVVKLDPFAGFIAHQRIDGLARVSGAAVLLLGIKTRWHYLRLTEDYQVEVLPVPMGRDGQGLALVGVFRGL